MGLILRPGNSPASFFIPAFISTLTLVFSSSSNPFPIPQLAFFRIDSCFDRLQDSCKFSRSELKVLH
ncbi:hypothetical protein K1719_032436 [Acacia pycnantha]|nr:hypothetical protein K1719_032436 [Acacia pycnantha]